MKLMILIRTKIALVLSLFACSCLGSAGLPDFEKYLDSFSKHIGFNGNVLIAKDQKVLFSKSYGFANFLTKAPLTEASQFCVGSITKQFTAVAILKLIQEGKFSLSDRICVLIPEFASAPWAQTVTVEHLLSHTSGIARLSNEQMAKMGPITEVQQVIEYFKDQNTVAPPGSSFGYNNYGYIILGYLVEIVSKKDLSTFFKETFFDPLGMHATAFEPLHSSPATQKYPNLSSPHEVNPDGSVKPIETLEPFFSSAAGGLISTPGDLAKWNAGLYSGSIINETLLREFVSPRKLTYGLGIITEVFAGGSLVHKHGGGIQGYCSALLYLPKQSISICVLSNVENDPPRVEPIADHLSLMALEAEL